MNNFHGYMNTMGSEEDNISSQKEGDGNVEEGHVFKDTPLLINGDSITTVTGYWKIFPLKKRTRVWQGINMPGCVPNKTSRTSA